VGRFAPVLPWRGALASAGAGNCCMTQLPESARALAGVPFLGQVKPKSIGVWVGTSATACAMRYRCVSAVCLSGCYRASRVGGLAMPKTQREERRARARRWPPGTRLWVKLRGLCRWPVAAWAFALCRRRDIEQLLQTHRPGAPAHAGRPAPAAPRRRAAGQRTRWRHRARRAAGQAYRREPSRWC